MGHWGLVQDSVATLKLTTPRGTSPEFSLLTATYVTSHLVQNSYAPSPRVTFFHFHLWHHESLFTFGISSLPTTFVK
ncbi:protein of unknown function [Nitrospira japonica]|uniref:Uncharacterized protein n=1 Tax=Nitrospira japonica TaxID=1325564 RepID=A0A1W1I6Q6_9BACT|nr:protein of unknown function [Nitrospira japonica]